VKPLRIDHTAIAVRDMDEALGRYRRILGIEPSDRQVVPDQQVEIAFLRAGATQLELISPIASDTGVARFLARHGESLHHIAFAVPDIEEALRELDERGIELIDRRPRHGVHGRVAFVHPRGTGGVLVELVENPDSVD
jgi:methylmalonyl-CoA/ethylmalonyl-CoA epimerase